MKTKVNRKELIDVFKSDINGAVIISRDSNRRNKYAEVIPAHIGVKTYIGCVEFGPGNDDCIYDDSFSEDFSVITLRACIKLYFDFPDAGNAWLVVPKGEDFVWTRIDHLLRFQNEADGWYYGEEDEINELYEKRYNFCIGDNL